METFDLALGLRVCWCAVLLGDAQDRQQVFEAVVPAGEPCGVDRTVVGQC